MSQDNLPQVPAMFSKCLAEAIGAFTLTFAGTAAIAADSASTHGVGLVGIALAFGLAIMAMIYAIGDISGAHMNPAVTIGFAASGRFPLPLVVPYVISQCIGGIAASGLLYALIGNDPSLGHNLGLSAFNHIGPGNAFGFEIVLTFFLVFVVLCVATGSKEQGLMAGIAIGGTIILDICFGGNFSGASMNPARSLGPAVVTGNFKDLWIYILGPIAGGLVAVPFWILIRRKTSSIKQA